jgi:hypothetical protein
MWWCFGMVQQRSSHLSSDGTTDDPTDRALTDVQYLYPAELSLVDVNRRVAPA